MMDACGSLNIGGVLGPGGIVAESSEGFEHRPEQIEMAEAVQSTLSGGGRLAVEAGTGVGKSFAYLIPAIDIVNRGAGKILVSTFTITLQEQLINKDVPFLIESLPYTFTAVLAKGRGNYLCRRRLEFALRRQKGLFDEFGTSLAVINDWARQTKDGSLSDIGFLPRSGVWDAVKSEHGNCRGRRCPHFKDCFYWRARRRLESADIIVTNHALMFSDLVLKDNGASVLPEYRYVIVDEAHNIEHVAEEHFGINVNAGRIKFLLDGLYDPRRHKGLLSYAGSVAKAEKAIDIVVRTAKESRAFFKRVSDWYEQTKAESGGRCYVNFVEDNLSGHLNDLRAELTRLAKEAEDEDERFEVLRFVDHCTAVSRDLTDFLTQKRSEYIYWVEPSGETKAKLRLRGAAINVGADVKRVLFDRYGSVALTSATLSSNSAGNKSGFEFFANSIGLSDYKAVKIGSPFDYQRQITLYIEKDMPNPNEMEFIAAAGEALKKYILQTRGRAFVLFTSYRMLERMAESLADWLGENDIELLAQGAGLDRGVLLENFKGSNNSSVLFGTDSFWQGVDVPGEALSNVIIVKLPFAVPDKPLLAGRLERIRQRGGNPFYDYQLPAAIIKFKQGFGRLIRSKSDTGIVVILDSRIVNKRYGRKFLEAVPRCKIQVVATRG